MCRKVCISFIDYLSSFCLKSPNNDTLFGYQDKQIFICKDYYKHFKLGIHTGPHILEILELGVWRSSILISFCTFWLKSFWFDCKSVNAESIENSLDIHNDINHLINNNDNHYNWGFAVCPMALVCHLLYIFSPTHEKETMVITFHRWGSWNAGKLSDFPRVIQLINVRQCDKNLCLNFLFYPQGMTLVLFFFF